jgi:CRISPR-associated protein Csh1
LSKSGQILNIKGNEMLSAIKDLGYLVSSRNTYIKKQLEGKILFIVLDETNSSFQEIGIEDFDIEKADRYLYKKGASKGNRPAPIAQITDIIKTFRKLKKWVDNCQNIPDISNADLELIKKINGAIEKNASLIEESLKTKFNELSKKMKKFLAIKLENDKKYIGDCAVFRRALSYFEDRKREGSLEIDKICSICGHQKDEVSGITDVFKFYTVDKPGFITGGFDKALAWKNFPVCSDCKIMLEKGKEYLESKLNFKFYGLNYLLIPKLLFGDERKLEELLDIITNASQEVSLSERKKETIASEEDEILELLGKANDFLTLNFLFIQRQQSAERILLYIEDVFPSRIRTIFDAKAEVDKAFGEKFNFGKLREFFMKSDETRRERDLDKYFLDIIDAIFRGKKINFSFLVKFYMAAIRREFFKEKIKQELGHFLIKDAMMNNMFLETLKVISFQEAKEMEKSIFDQFFSYYGKSLATPEKKGLVLLGALAQMLLNRQQADRGSKPFMKKLKSFKMEEKDIRGLLPQIQNKLEEYDSFDRGKRLIAEEASKYLLMSGINWRMSVDEINFYFACGMNLCNEIASIAYKKEE